MKEEVYQVYSQGDPNIAIHEKGMDERMLDNTYILFRSPDIQPDDLTLARTIWQKIRNPRVVSNDLSHPNNWTAYDLKRLAREIRAHYERD